MWKFWLVVLALILGLVGFRHDWPLIYGIEGQQVAAAVRFAYAPQFDHFCCLTYPPIYFYFMAVIFRIVAWSEKILGIVPNWNAWMLKILVDPSEATMIARGISLLSFCLTMWGGYKTAKRIAGRVAGLLTAMIMLTTPSLVVFSKLGQSEMPLVALVTWSLFFSVKLLTGDVGRKNLFWASCLAGLAVATKYNALPVVIPIVVYLSLTRRPLIDWLMAMMIGVTVLMVSHPFTLKLVFSRYFFDLVRINPNYALERLIPEPMAALASALRTGDFEKQRHTNTLTWTWELIKNHEGWLAWLMLGGVMSAINKLSKAKLALILVIVGQLMLVSRLGGLDNEFHYLLPLYPAGLVLAGMLISKFIINRKMLGTLTFGVLTLIWGWWLLKPIVASQFELMKAGTDTVVKQWLATNSQGGEIVVRGHNSPLKLTRPDDSIILPMTSLSPSLQEQIKEWGMTHPQLREEVFRKDLVEADWPDDWDNQRISRAKEESFIERLFRFGYWTVDELIAEKVAYVVLGSYELEEAYHSSWQEPGSDLDLLYKRGQLAYRSFLEDPRVEEVYRVEPGIKYRGPEMRVYQVKGTFRTSW